MRSPARQRGKVASPADVADDLLVQTWAQMAYAYHRIIRRIEQGLAADGVSLAQFEILIRLHIDGAISPTALATRLLVTKGNISGLLNRMARAKLVRRQSDREDRRAYKLLLTPRGRQLFARVFPKHIELIREITKPLKRTELSVVHAAMQQLLPRADGGPVLCPANPLKK